MPVIPLTLRRKDTVLIENHTASLFDPVYIRDYQVDSIEVNQFEGIPATGDKPKLLYTSDIKYVLLADNVISKLPAYSTWDHKSKLPLNPDHMPDLHWKSSTSANTILVTTTTPVSSIYTYTPSFQNNVTSSVNSVSTIVSAPYNL